MSFRSDLAAFLDDQTIDRAIDSNRPLELPPKEGIIYSAFTDPSGGRGDDYTLAISHLEDDRVIIDVVRGVKPPFDPKLVTAEFATLCKEYHILTIRGDNYSAEWVVSAFRECGITYELSELKKSELALEALPLFMRGCISIPDHKRLIRELRVLERSTSNSGDKVDHPKYDHDDYANALFGAMYGASHETGVQKWERFGAACPPIGGPEAMPQCATLYSQGYYRGWQW